MLFDKSTWKSDIFGPGKPGKNKNMTRKKLATSTGAGRWPSGFGQTSVVDPLGVCTNSLKIRTKKGIFQKKSPAVSHFELSRESVLRISRSVVCVSKFSSL